MIKEDKEYCFYCDCVVTTKGVGDHMPVPQRHGGDDSVPCCLSCHDMKDRIPFEQWSFSWKDAVMRDIPRMSRETRIFLGKAMSICLDRRDIMYMLSRHGLVDFYPTNASYSHIYMMCFFPETTDSL